MKWILISAILLSVAGCQDGQRKGVRAVSGATEGGSHASGVLLRYMGLKPGQASEKWSDGRSVTYLEIRIENNQTVSAVINGVMTASGFNMSQPQAEIMSSMDGKSWISPFIEAADFAPPPDRIVLEPKESKLVLVPFPKTESTAPHWRACIRISEQVSCTSAFSLSKT